MKKSLFAIAAVTAFAGAAQAQSSVTVYGIMDVGYIGGNVRSTNASSNTSDATNGGAFPATTANAGGTQTLNGNYNGFGSSAESTSRLGFRGTEDLGGGMSAFFTIETGLQPTNSTLSSFNNRQSFVGLMDKKIGSVSIGTQYTPIHTAVGATSAGQQNNMVGDVIYPIAPANNGNTAVTTLGSTTSAFNSATDGYTIRTANMLRLQSTNMAGFVATAFYTANDQNTTYQNSTSGGTNNQNGWGLGLNYSIKKLLVSANYQAFTSKQTPDGYSWDQAIRATSASTPVTIRATRSTINGPALWTGAAGGSNIRDNQMYVAATYDFGILKAYAQYINRKATSQLDSANYLNRSAQQIGVRGFITPKIEGWASGGTGRYDAYGASNPTVNFTGYQLGSNYWLSKRTNVYAIFGSTQQSSGNAAMPSIGANNYAAGVRHTF
jgi:predicted porin